MNNIWSGSANFLPLQSPLNQAGKGQENWLNFFVVFASLGLRFFDGWVFLGRSSVFYVFRPGPKGSGKAHSVVRHTITSAIAISELAPSTTRGVKEVTRSERVLNRGFVSAIARSELTSSMTRVTLWLQNQYREGGGEVPQKPRLSGPILRNIARLSLRDPISSPLVVRFAVPQNGVIPTLGT